MKLRGLIDEDFTNYKKASMFLAFPYCDLKCDKECGLEVCQNSPLLNNPIIETNETTLLCRYLSNKITKAIVCGGMEPFDSAYDLMNLIDILRTHFKCDDDIVIYTGYTEEELAYYTDILSQYNNIIIKFGRYIPNQKPHFDTVLGIELASDNQYAVKIS